MMKKLVALLMALALLCSCIGAFAEDVDHSGCTNNHKSTSEDKPDVAATCTEDGYEWWWCNEHGYYKVKTEEKLGHDFSEFVEYITEPTYTSEGEATYKCSRCDATEDRPVDKLTTAYGPTAEYTEYIETPDDGHHKHGWYSIKLSTDPTCTEDGFYKILCADCGEIKAANCTDNQVQRFTCKVCQFPDDREVPDTKLGHTWETGESQETHDHVVKQPTCAEEGSIGDAVICDRCGAPDPDTLTTVQKIDAIDHTAEWEERILGINEDGEIDYDIDYKKLADDLYKELKALGLTLPALNEDLSNIQDVIAAVVAQNVPLETLITILDEVTVDIYPRLYYKLPGADDETGEGYLDLSKVASIPEYEIPIAVEIGDGSEGSTNPIQTVTTTGLVHETKVTYNAPSCNTKGSIVLTCTTCKADPYVIELPEVEHFYIPIRGVKGINDLEGVVIKDCTKANSILQKCVICGHRYNQWIEPAKSHTIQLDSKEFDPWKLSEYDDNCMIVGFVQQKEWDDAPITYYVDEEMSDTVEDFYYGSYGSYKEKVMDAFSHIATCRDFDVIVKCAVPFCEHTEKIHVDAYTEHDASEYVIDVAPTCTKPGYIGFNCEACGEFHTEEIIANGHDPIDGKTLVEPTCTEKGSREIICSVCKEVIGTEEIPALDHHFVPYFDPADCKIGKAGISYQYCSKCGYIDPTTVVEDDGHRYEEDDITAYTAPTCTTKGSISFVCNICHKDIVNKEIKELGHDYVEDLQKRVPATCKIGEEHGTIHYYECSRCGDNYTKEDDDIPAHNMYKVDGSLNRFNVVTLPTCEKEGKAQFVCTRCFCLVENVVLDPLPHNYKITFNENTGAYELVCTKVEISPLGLTNLYNKMVENGYDEKVAAAIIDLLGQSVGTYIKGVGCGDVQPIEIRKTEYTITKVSETRGQIELVEGALWAKDDEYVRIVWRYTLGNGDTISFVTTREVRWTEDEETGKWIGSFKLTGLTVPEDATCNFIRVEVVTDPDADELYAGQYDTYGYEVWKY